MINSIQTSIQQVAAHPGEPVLSTGAARLLDAGVPEATRRAYRADRAEWAAWAAATGARVLPPDPVDLLNYVTFLLEEGSPLLSPPLTAAQSGTRGSRRPLSLASVERRLSAISTWAVEQGHERPNLRPVRVALRGYRRTQAEATRQAAPATIGVLSALVAQAVGRTQGEITARAARDRAIVLLGFALAARRSELVRVDLEDLLERPEGLLVRVVRSKTTQSLQEVAVTFASRDPQLCPVRAVQDLAGVLADRGLTSGPLFRRITRADTVLGARLTPQSVNLVVQRLAVAAGVPIPAGFAGYSGHSLRRGMATEARRAGHDAVAIARGGGWRDGSTALNRYLSDVDKWEATPLRGVL